MKWHINSNRIDELKKDEKLLKAVSLLEKLQTKTVLKAIACGWGLLLCLLATLLLTIRVVLTFPLF